MIIGQRRDFFVKKWFQARIACYYLLILAAGGAALSFVIYKRAVATLRYCLFRGHSTECSSWELLRDAVVSTNVVATIIVVSLAIATVLLLSGLVARSSRVVRANIRATISGQAPGFWPQPPRPHEFRNLQAKLAAGVIAHGKRVEELRSVNAGLLAGIREACAALDQRPRGASPVKVRELQAGYGNLKNRFRGFRID